MPSGTASAESPADGGINMVPNQLAMLVPSFDPATDSVDTWTQKIEMLLVAWPRQKLDELATRLVLNCRGTAFQKLQLHRSEVLKNEEKAIKRIVELVGGTWGQVPLEQRFELVEKGLYRSQQKSDESADSYLARLDVTWTELMTKGISLEEIQSYVVLRGSKLAAEDKKRVIVESGGETSGQLSMKKVTAAIRMIGSNFFQEMTGNRRDKSLKVYDSQTFVAEDDEEFISESFMVTDDFLDDETVEILATEHQDDDASLVMQFEEAITEAIQGDADLAAYFSTYQEARRRLSEKVRTRGFWPMSKGYGKKGGKFHKGKGRASLAQRIANSHCRRCGKKGHWRAECPLLSGRQDSRTTASSGSSEVAPTSYVTVEEVIPEIANIPEFEEPSPGVKGLIAACCACFNEKSNGFKTNQNRGRKGLPSQALLNKFTGQIKHHLRSRVNAECVGKSHSVGVDSPNAVKMMMKPQDPIPSTPKSESADACFVSSGTIGVVDLGASQTVMGDQQLKEFLQNLPSAVRSRVRRAPCDIVFRFGNHQTLASKHSLMLPLQNQWIRIAIVKGKTPFLLSSTFLKNIKAIIDVEEGTLWSKLLDRPLSIERTSKSLFMLDINQLWQEPGMAVQPPPAGDSPDQSESFPKRSPICAADSCEFQIDETDKKTVEFHKDKRVSQNTVNDTMIQVNSDAEKSQPSDSDLAVCADSRLSTPIDRPRPAADHHAEVSVRSSEGLPQCPPRGASSGGQSTSGPNDSGRVEEGEHCLRDCSQGQILSAGVRATPAVGGLVHINLREEHQSGASKVHPLRGIDSGRREQGQPISNSQSSGEQGQTGGSIELCSLVDGSGSQCGGRRLRGTGKPSSCPESPRRDVVCQGGKSTTTWSPLSTGTEHVANPRSPPEVDGQGREVMQPEVTDPIVSIAVSTDSPSLVTEESEFHSYHRICQGLIRKMTQEYQEVMSSKQTSHHRFKLDLLEIMCSDQSELTRQVELSKGSAQRFGLSEGDLSQPSVRKQLFQIIVDRDPKDIWYSPECNPWCLWSNLNGTRSIEAFDQMVLKRTNNLWQISLAVVLYRIQVSRRKHFHMEQPGGSLMWSQPCVGEILSNTLRCRFDLCRVGQLVDPSTGLPIRKRLTVQTTSQALHRKLNDKLCSQDHNHQRIEGNTRVNGETVRRSTFTERYPIRFARQIAKTLIHEKPWEPPAYCLATDSSEHPTKRRRLGQKMSAEEINRRFTNVNWRTVMDEADRVAPRVGILIQENNDLCRQVQQLCPQHEIQHIVLCRGTDRYVGPNKPLQPGIAPFRRRICIRRRLEDVVVDPEWEQWERLTFKGLRRKGVAARVSLTIFAKLKVPDTVTSSLPSADVQHRRSAENSSLPEAKRPRRPTVTFDDSSRPDVSPETPVIDNPTSDRSPESTEEPSREIIDLIAQKHGPKFLALSKEDQSWLLKLHRNLGHPSAAKLIESCRQLNCDPHILHAVPDLKCSTCVETQRPHVARPSATHSEGDFGDSISMDGITWTNAKGQQFHFYHFLDHHTTYHTAIVSSSRTTEDAIKALCRGWMLWAGPPAVLCLDAATEFTSEGFLNFMQKSNIKGRVIATEGHWQNSQIERHGGVLQKILQKMDLEQAIESYEQLELALAIATHTKNQWSRYRGYPPEMLVFGKMTRVPGSVVSDITQSSHMLALSEQAEGIRFREELAMRERARKAFSQIDNDQACRRAIHHRSRPSRGQYEKGEWIMVWRKRGEATGNWQGPMQVIIQEGHNVIWATMGNKLFRAAPENVRPLSAVEEATKIGSESKSTTPGDNLSIRPTHGGAQLHDLTTVSGTMTVPSVPINHDISIGSEGVAVVHNPNIEPATAENSSQQTTGGEQPDVEPAPIGTPAVVPQFEPENPINNGPSDAHNIPIPESDTSEDSFYACEEDCFYLDSTQAWKLEIDVCQQDINRWKQEEHPTEMSFLVTAAKKQRSEVKLHDLTIKEQELFRQAKDKEIDSWIQTGTVAKILRHQIPLENIMRCRWILTWKEIDESERKASKSSQSQFKPKARLVVLGYTDPCLEDIPRDSPTMTKMTRMMILQFAASNNWDIESFDIKTAFLRGSEQGDRTLGIEPPSELRERLKLKPSEVLQLLKGAYGRVDAPFLWFMELRRKLLDLQFQQSPFDPCMFVLPNAETGQTEGMIGVHVDDGLCCGSERFQQKLKELETIFPFGSHKRRKFVFTGLHIEQHSDHSITVQQSQYVKDINPINVCRERKQQLEDVVTEKERQDLRALVGSLSYAAINSRPDLRSRIGWLQSSINKACVNTLVEANKILHEGKLHADTALRVQPIRIDDIRFVAFSDASFASAKSNDSHQGMMIMTAHKCIGENKVSAVNPLLWHSKKIQKVAVSTLSAEAMALAGTVDMLSWVRLYWAWINDVACPWRKADELLLRLPPAFSALPPPEDSCNEQWSPPDELREDLKHLPKKTESIIATDCKSLFDLISRTAPPACQEFRTQLQAKLIKEHINNGIQIRWVPSGAQVADSLTKVMDNTMIRECLRQGRYALHDEHEILRSRSDSRARLQWFRQQGSEANGDADI